MEWMGAVERMAELRQRLTTSWSLESIDSFGFGYHRGAAFRIQGCSWVAVPPFVRPPFGTWTFCLPLRRACHDLLACHDLFGAQAMGP